jgi:hypothetical protein
MSMSITVHPELEATLRSRAEEEGVSVDAYLERLVQDDVAEIAHTETLLKEAAGSGEHIELTEQEWDRMEQEALAEAHAKLHRRA